MADQHRRARLFEHNGRSRSLAAWAAEFGIAEPLLRKRLRRGYSLAEALTSPKGVHRGKALELDGEQVAVEEAARRAGLPSATLRSRLAAGWALADAMGKPVQEGGAPPRMLTHDGRTQNLAAWARELGFSHQLLWARLEAGWPVEKALTAKKGAWLNSQASRNGNPVNASQAAREAGANPNLVRHRLNRGWTLERALAEPRQEVGGGRFPPRPLPTSGGAP